MCVRVLCVSARQVVYVQHQSAIQQQTVVGGVSKTRVVTVDEDKVASNSRIPCINSRVVTVDEDKVACPLPLLSRCHQTCFDLPGRRGASQLTIPSRV